MAASPPLRVLVRCYDRTNLGDDLLVQLLAKRYANPITVLMHDANGSLENLPHVTRADSQPTRLRRRVGRALRRRATATGVIERAARDHDLLVHIGGSIFIEHEGSGEHWRRERAHYAALPVPYTILSANYGPARSPEFPAIIRDIAAGAADICFRDEASYRLFAELPSARVATDVGFLAEPPARPARRGADVVIAPIDLTDRFPPDVVEEYEAAIAAGAEEAAASGARVCLLSFCLFQGDGRAADRIAARLSASAAEATFRHDYRGDLDESLAILAGARTVVSARFHAIVLGLAFGAAVLPIAYSAKTLEVLSDLGLDGPVVDLSAPGVAQAIESTAPWRMSDADRARTRALAAAQFAVLDGLLVRAAPTLADAPLSAPPTPVPAPAAPADAALSPRVDIVIPLYEKAAVIDRAVDSVLAQTFADWRLHIVDDGSTDGGRPTASDPRIHVVRQDNAGPGAARNAGAALGDAEYIAFLDADDEWMPEYLARQVAALDADPARAAATTGWFRGEATTDVDEQFEARGIGQGTWTLEDTTPVREFKMRLDSLHSSATVVRRDVFERSGGFYENRCTFGEDSYLWTAVALTRPVHRSKEPLLRFHVDASSLSFGRSTPYPLPPILTDPGRLQQAAGARWGEYMPRYLEYYVEIVLRRAVAERVPRQAVHLLTGPRLETLGLSTPARWRLRRLWVELSARAAVLRLRGIATRGGPRPTPIASSASARDATTGEAAPVDEAAA